MTDWLTVAHANATELRALVDAGTREVQHDKVCRARRHGTATAYQVDRCRCPSARDAQRRYIKRWKRDKETGRTRKVDATGTHRRIQALMVNGWSLDQIMERAGYRKSGNWIKYDATTLHVNTAAKIAEVYNELWDKPGPSKWTRTWARNQGYLPPLAWDDDTIDDPAAWGDLGPLEVIENDPPCQGFDPAEHAGDNELLDHIAVERFVAGDLSWRALSVAERKEAARVMQRNGLSHKEIHERCHVNSQQLAAVLAEAKLSTGRVEVVGDSLHTHDRTDMQEAS